MSKNQKNHAFIFYKKNTYFNIENLYDHYGKERGIHQFFTFFQNCKVTKIAKVAKIAKKAKKAIS
jgi:glycerol dehydrogenase-like iron-containing ADH family enzyme